MAEDKERDDEVVGGLGADGGAEGGGPRCSEEKTPEEATMPLMLVLAEGGGGGSNSTNVPVRPCDIGAELSFFNKIAKTCGKTVSQVETGP